MAASNAHAHADLREPLPRHTSAPHVNRKKTEHRAALKSWAYQAREHEKLVNTASTPVQQVYYIREYKAT